MGKKVTSKKKQIHKMDEFFVEWMFSLLAFTLLIGFAILLSKYIMQKEAKTPKFWLLPNTPQSLIHVEFVLSKIGFKVAASSEDDWDVLWNVNRSKI